MPIKELNLCLKNLCVYTHTHSAPVNFTGEFHETFKKEVINSSENWREENMSHLILSFYEACITVIQMEDIMKENYRSISLGDVKILDKIITDQI